MCMIYGAENINWLSGLLVNFILSPDRRCMLTKRSHISNRDTDHRNVSNFNKLSCDILDSRLQEPLC